nr:glycosyltransferase [Bacteroidota bacterium]
MLKFSIITVCFNSSDTIESTIRSVVSQDHLNIQYIIIDGASTDNTLTIIEKFKEEISIIISEKDNGLYHAINKGILLATGDIVGIIHADDFYVNSHVISEIVDV